MTGALRFAYVVPCLYFSLYDILYWSLGLCFSNSTQLFIFASKKNHKNNELLSLFSTYQSTFLINGSSSFKENIFYKVGLIMYKYSLNILPECKAHLYLRNDSIHEHNTRGCHELKVLPGAKNFSNIRARIWNVLSNKINCDLSMSTFKCNLNYSYCIMS